MAQRIVQHISHDRGLLALATAPLYLLMMRYRLLSRDFFSPTLKFPLRKKTGCLGFLGDDKLPSYIGDYFMSLYKDPY